MTEKALKPYVFKLQGLITRGHLSEDDRRYLAGWNIGLVYSSHIY